MRVIPLGGCGQFGRNVTAYEAHGEVVLVDCGIQLPDDLSFGVERYVPDLRGLLSRVGTPAAVFLTHGHDDHVGAVPHLLSTSNAPIPIHGRPLTLRLLREFLDEAKIPSRLRDLRELHLNVPVPIGGAGSLPALLVTPLSLCHSIPEACALLIEGAGRRVLHTGDFKLDGGAGLDHLPRSTAEAPVDLLVSDSTNATRPGRSGPEEVTRQALSRVLFAARGRVIVALFSSHIERIAGFADSCAHAGRRLCLIGRGLLRATTAARETGAFRPPATLLCNEEEAARLPPSKVAVLCTGSQGEPEAALARLCAHLLNPSLAGSKATPRRVSFSGPWPAIDPLDEGPDEAAAHPGFTLCPSSGDTVVLAARTLPGGERALGRIVDRLLSAGVEVLSGPDLSTSGHGCADELRELIEWVHPVRWCPSTET